MICPICEKDTTIRKVTIDEIIVVKDEEITVPVTLFWCSDCGKDFEDPKAEIGPVELAYKKYCKIKGIKYCKG